MNPSLPPHTTLETWMKRALELAYSAFQHQEVPIGAVIFHQDREIAARHNEVESQQSVLAHAELLAIGDAAKKLGNWSLSECVLVVTAEPCPQCMGAILLSRIPFVIYGTREHRTGAAGSVVDLALPYSQLSSPRVIGGILEDECRTRLEDFFRLRRG